MLVRVLPGAPNRESKSIRYRVQRRSIGLVCDLPVCVRKQGCAHRQDAQNQKKRFVIPVTHPCPCGSGLSIAECEHLDPWDNRFRKPVPSLRPPSPNTGYSHSRCYLRATMDCSEKISGEHPMSRSLLVQLGDAVQVSGAHWQSEGETFVRRQINWAA